MADAGGKDARAWIALGANLGDRRRTIEQALDLLRKSPGITVEAVSTLIETEPVGGPPGQPLYLNGAAELRTGLAPRDLLNVLLAVEKQLGRDRSSGIRNAPRPIDLDLLLYESVILDSPDLTIPHPRMHERQFVLRPMGEIAPDVIHPVLKKTVRELTEMLA
jgi:2-amino-4-hydroxy-6-hydroxymethyldihydropteridine diphosphokinase